MANFVETEIESREHGKTARVTIDNQRKLNTLNSTVIGELNAALLPSIIGVNRARDLVLTGRTWTAKEAFEAGLVQRLCADSKLDDEVDTVLEEILLSGREAIKIQKQLCNDWENNPLARGIQLGIDAFSEAFISDEPETMMQQFLNRER